jgi:hypothetical protein
MVNIILNNYNWIFLVFSMCILLFGGLFSVLFKFSKSSDALVAKLAEYFIYFQLFVWIFQLAVHIIKTA